MRTTKKREKKRIAELLSTVGKQQIAVAELEAVGLPLRIINLLEDYLGVIWLEDLLNHTPDELRESVPNLGEKSLKLILDSVNRLAGVLHRMPSKSNGSVVTLAVLPSNTPTSDLADCAS